MSDKSRSPFNYLASALEKDQTPEQLRRLACKTLWEIFLEIREISSTAVGGFHHCHDSRGGWQMPLEPAAACQAVYRLIDDCHYMPDGGQFEGAAAETIRTWLQRVYETGEEIYNGKPPFRILASGEFTRRELKVVPSPSFTKAQQDEMRRKEKRVFLLFGGIFLAPVVVGLIYRAIEGLYPLLDGPALVLFGIGGFSLVMAHACVVSTALIGQKTTRPEYLHEFLSRKLRQLRGKS